MGQVIDFFKGLFDVSLWPPRWHCGKWTEFHGWLYIISDLLIFSAYFAIPLIIVRYIATRTNSRFHKIYFLFAAFILACGFTHLLDAISFWYPVYRFNALVRFITGIISWATVYYLIRILPVAFSLKTAGELEIEVEQRKRAEEELQIKVQLLNEAQEIARMGHWEWNPATGYITFSDNLLYLYGLNHGGSSIQLDQFLGSIHPEDRAAVDAMFKQAASNKKFIEIYHRIITPYGAVKTMHTKGEVMAVENGGQVKIIGTGQDVTDQKSIEQALLIKSSELESRNAELQKFAYVASHDLQEPLRKILTFISRIQGDEVLPRDKEQEYLEKIVLSASRMQQLITDILTFSRVSAGDAAPAPFQYTELNSVLKSVLVDMEVAIENNKAIITADELPGIQANASQMGQLFQNLISNAIKFRKTDEPAIISIKAAMITGADIEAPEWTKARYKFSGWNETRLWMQEKFCRITVTDNGIGFDQMYADRIFEAFQRLDRDHEGTGIGLAICKKIVENHHGMISVESSPAKGTTFTIALPLSQVNFE